MARQQGLFALILALAIAATAVLSSFSLQLGLDLKGGSQLTLQVQPTEEIKKISPEAVEAVKVVLDKRVNGLGVSESTLQTVGQDQLLLELPGEQDPSRAAKVLGQTALLEFRAQKKGTENEMLALKTLRSQLRSVLNYKLNNSGSEDSSNLINEQTKVIDKAKKLLGISQNIKNDLILIDTLIDEISTEIVKLFEPAYLTGKDLVSAGRQQEQNLSGWEVTLSFNQEGAKKFAELTQSIAGSGRLLGIVLDGSSISEASVGEQFRTAGITGGAATISGNFTAETARDLEVQLRGGSLPLPVEIIEVRTVGPSLGAENIRRSLIVALSGLVLVAIFMVSIYRLAGLVAISALCLYALFNIAIYALIPVTLTLPGIAGFILSIGMAVDANILIFERIKDELRRRNTLIRSIETGFSEAFSSIVDGHLTTLISCIALFSLGTGLVKGFAATLGIGVLLSLFTALLCTKILLRFLMSYQTLRKITYFLPLKQLNSSTS